MVGERPRQIAAERAGRVPAGRRAVAVDRGVCGARFFAPKAIEVTSLSEMVAPTVLAGGKLALALLIVGVVAATFGAAPETTLSAGYTLAQFFGWPWGKFRRPAQASRFHVVMIVSLVIGCAVLSTGIDPIMITEYSVVCSAIALPLTYLPMLLVANDPEYMGERVNGRFTNALAMVYLWSFSPRRWRRYRR